MCVCVVQECLAHIIAALDHHLEEVDIQTKALVLLGVLIQVCVGGGRGEAAACGGHQEERPGTGRVQVCSVRP